MVDVTVVVPFFNPAANLDDCIASLLDQTLDRSRFEVVLVDDGSTDGSDLRAQHFVDANPELMRLLRIPASGWPGKPRNVGVDTARGSYVQFVDSDDVLDPEALERMLGLALASNADIVVGKLSSDFRGLNHPVFRHTVTGRTIHDYPLVETLTPHKMVRRALLTDHGIRFAEGPRHVEDEHFSMQIYTRARSIAVVGDLPCYFYRRRRVSGRNLGDTEAVPADYYRDLAAVLDVIDQHVDDPQMRAPLQRRFYRNEMLGRLRGRQMLGYSADFRRDIFDRVRDLATTRFVPEVREGLGCFIRAQSRLVIDDDLDALTSYAGWLASIRLRATVSQIAWNNDNLTLDIAATLFVEDAPLVLERDGDSWLLPRHVAPTVPRDDRLVTEQDLASADLDCATISRADSQLWSTTDGLALSISDAGQVHITGTVNIDPLTLRGGAPMGPGLWDLRLRVMFAGLTTASSLLPAGEAERVGCNLLSGTLAAQPYWTSPNPTLAVDIGEWSHSLTDRIPEDVEPTLRRRRFELAVPTVTGAPTSIPARLVLASTDDDSPPIHLPASLDITGAGATLRGKLPRTLADAQWQIWAQIGDLGSAAARKLPWLIVKSGRSVHLLFTSDAGSNSTPDT